MFSFKSIKYRILSFLDFVPDRYMAYTMYYIKHGKVPNLKEPKSFNEKINWMRLFETNQLKKAITDRVWVRSYVSDKAPTCQLIPLLWQGEELTLEDFGALPEKFVIKGNHGSKMVKIVSKKTDGFEQLRELTRSWMELDYYKIGRENVYKDLKKYLLVEEKLDDPFSDVPPDFKFHCFHGKVEFVQVDSDRFSGHKRNLYDRDFVPLHVEYGFPQGDNIPRPKAYRQALAIAERLAGDFNFIRVDLFLIGDQVYFGELTNFPDNGLAAFSPRSFDGHLGSKLQLKKN